MMSWISSGWCDGEEPGVAVGCESVGFSEEEEVVGLPWREGGGRRGVAGVKESVAYAGGIEHLGTTRAAEREVERGEQYPGAFNRQKEPKLELNGGAEDRNQI